MDTMPMRFTLIITLCTVLHVHCDGPKRRFLNQLNSFRREVREDLGYINSDISTLFKSVEDLKKPGTNDLADQRGYNTNEPCGKCAVDCRVVSNADIHVNSAILKALESEKRLNRHLQNKLHALEEENRLNRQYRNKVKTLEDALSDIAVDMDIFLTFMAYVNDTLQNHVTVKPTTGIPHYPDTTNVPVSTRKSKSLESSYCSGARKNGVFDIHIKSINQERAIYCDADTDGGGWIVMMRRQDGSTDFDRDWNDYKRGFGNIDGDYWMGNDLIHALTKSKSMELRIDMEDYAGKKVYAKYSHFEVGPDVENYVLNVGGYRGTAGDSLVNVSHSGGIHNGMAFSTRDKDNDLYDGTNCAAEYPGGWWHNRCFRSHLTGTYGDITSVKPYQGILWYSWTEWGRYLKYVDMKIR